MSGLEQNFRKIKEHGYNMCSKKTIEAYIGLGSNSGDSENILANARKQLSQLPKIAIIDSSRLYVTEPQGMKAQKWFVNQVVRLECVSDANPHQLLAQLQEIETKLGRVRDPCQRFGPRTIDLDLLLFGNCICSDSNLVLPHPRIKERAFVLVPLQELAPGFILPCGYSVESALSKLDFHLDGTKIYQ